MKHELELLEFVIEAHKDQTRRFDNKTLYSAHPIWCAYALLVEPTLPRKKKDDYFQALLCHDIYEDTDKKLPSYVSKRTRELVREMTFEGGMKEEMEGIWEKSPEVRLLKLYDKVSNLLDSTWMSKEKLEEYKEFTRKLLKDVERNYGELNIVKLARVCVK